MGGYIPSTEAEQAQMLAFLGMKSTEELFADIPLGLRCGELNLPPAKSELEVRRSIAQLAAQNTVFPAVFRGAGAYRHYIPSIVKQVASKETFVTAYTPYQAEVSQGVLQAIFEYQTEMCTLTGMDCSNASLYDGPSAAAEAAAMCRDRRRNRVLVAAGAQPDTQQVMATYCASANVSMQLVPSKDGRLDFAALEQMLGDDVACLYLQSPNYLGMLEEVEAAAKHCHEAGAKLVVGCNPIALGLFKSPGECGADIAVGEGQPLGLPLGFGGPYLGFIACKTELLRRLPGRIVGETTDADGKRCFVLTLQAREQHIRREKAASSVCSNQALCALTATAYLAAMGPNGLRQAAQQCYSKAHYLADALTKIGFVRRYSGEFFHEFLTECPVDYGRLASLLKAQGILGGLLVDGGILWCCTELNTKAEMDRVVQSCKEVAGL